MGTSKREHRLLPVAGLLFSATLWGVVWYPLRLLEQAGLAGVWTSLISYSAALAVFIPVFVREYRVLRATPDNLVALQYPAHRRRRSRHFARRPGPTRTCRSRPRSVSYPPQ